ncbi:BTB/POZ domain-containing protein 1-like [Paramacrobiotus metropolitanus]|uniref:BTB/POZ domain-containing protein 1-like n=1 Tax=Paramacrobiotus metropolitanus TaxID=2943436 RepID=UPI002445DCEF|nr:BTB/POZ domain-containing protein 1-like [Paramacrobiotus metropolitanus]
MAAIDCKDRLLPGSPIRSPAPAPAVTRSNTWAERGKALLECPALSDVSFEVNTPDGPVKIPGHRIILSLASSSFEQLFTEDAAADGIVRIKDVGLEAFRNILRFLYTESCSQLSETNMVDTLLGARKYQLGNLVTVCQAYIRDHVTGENAISFVNQLSACGEAELAAICLNKLAPRPEDLFTCESFLSLNQQTLYEFVKKETFDVPETVLYDALCRWAKHACEAVEVEPTGTNMRDRLGLIFPLVEFNKMTAKQILDGPSKDGLLKPEQTVQLLEQIIQAPPPPSPAPVCHPPSPTVPPRNNYTRLCRFGSYADVDLTMQNSVALPHWIGLAANQTIYLHGVGLYRPTDQPVGGRFIKMCASVAVFRRKNAQLLGSTAGSFVLDAQNESSVCHILFPTPMRFEARETYEICVTYIKGLPGLRGTNGYSKLVDRPKDPNSLIVVVESCRMPRYYWQAAREGYHGNQAQRRQTSCPRCAALPAPRRYDNENAPYCECSIPPAATTEFAGQIPEFLVSIAAPRTSS